MTTLILTFSPRRRDSEGMRLVLRMRTARIHLPVFAELRFSAASRLITGIFHHFMLV
jgi:hypothetical protein